MTTINLDHSTNSTDLRDSLSRGEQCCFLDGRALADRRGARYAWLGVRCGASVTPWHLARPLGTCAKPEAIPGCAAARGPLGLA